MSILSTMFSESRLAKNNKKSYIALLVGILLITLFFALKKEMLTSFLTMIAGICFIFFFIKDVRVRFISTFAMLLLLQLNTSKQLLSYFGAAIFTGGLILIFV